MPHHHHLTQKNFTGHFVCFLSLGEIAAVSLGEIAAALRLPALLDLSTHVVKQWECVCVCVYVCINLARAHIAFVISVSFQSRVVWLFLVVRSVACHISWAI